MHPEPVEVKSALWEKLFVLPISLLFGGTGVMLLITPFVPSLHTNSWGQVMPLGIFNTVMTVVFGLGLLGAAACLMWTVLKYSIRADAQGICQTNGFFHQSIRWSDVAYYYLARNKRHHKTVQVEPFLCDSQGNILFQSFATLLVSTSKATDARHQLWQFVEKQLEGKKVEAPSIERDPATLAVKSLDVNWSEKSTAWKIARAGILLLYGLFWFGLGMVPLYYAVSHSINISGFGNLLLFIAFVGPLLPHLLWLEWKKRKNAKELGNSGAMKQS